MKKEHWILSGILLLGLLLRLYHFTSISLWHDEAFSALLIHYPWGEMFYRIGLDVHPPLYYIALRFWYYGFGDSLAALRGFSVFFGLATVWAAYLFVRAAFKSNKAALVTALLLAVSPFQIQYTSEARMYTFGAFLAILAAYFLVKALELVKSEERKEKSNSKLSTFHFPLFTRWTAFALTAGAAALTHYYLLFTVIALCLYALAHHFYYYRLNFRRYWLLATGYLLTALTFSPWLTWFFYQYKQVGAGYWIPQMDKWSIPTTIWQMLVGLGIDISKQPTQIMVVVACVFTTVFLIRFILKTQSPHKWLVLFALAAPFGGSLLFALLAHLKGQTSSVYLVRYFLYASTFYTIALAVWLTQIAGGLDSHQKARSTALLSPPGGDVPMRHRDREGLKNGQKTKPLRLIIACTLITLYTASQITTAFYYWHDLGIKEKTGMAGAVHYLENHVNAPDKLFVGTSFEFFNLKYYLSQNNWYAYGWPRPLLYTGGRLTKDMSHVEGTAILTDADLVPNFEQGAHSGDIVYLLWTTAFGSNKPAAPANWQQQDEAGFADVRPYVGTWIVVTKYTVQ